MIEVTDCDTRKIFLAPDAIAFIKEAGPSSQWHGIRSYITCFDGTKIECADTAEDVRRKVQEAQL